MLMGNTKKIESCYIKKVYDLKGSILKREVFGFNRKGEKLSREKFGYESHFKNTAVLKDVNLLNLCKD
jgi:hypothetical protein